MTGSESLITARRDPFADDVLQRLIASNQDYQRAHGHYIVPLAQRLLDSRQEIERLVKALGEIEGKARWYADNGVRDPQEVDHALCVEILDLAQRALDA